MAFVFGLCNWRMTLCSKYFRQSLQSKANCMVTPTWQVVLIPQLSLKYKPKIMLHVLVSVLLSVAGTRVC